MVNQDLVMELRDYLGEHGSMPREELAEWLLKRRRERFTAELQAVLSIMVSPSVATKEFAVLEQDEDRCRTWANKWLTQQGLNLKRARALEAVRWHAATRGTIRRWFAELQALFGGVRSEMVWNFDELMAAASRTGKAVVTGEAQLFSPQCKKTPHVTLGACFNCRGDAPPMLLVMKGPECALAELASLEDRLWLAVNSSGWVDRTVFRRWCERFAEWVAQIRVVWKLDPAEPAILVLDNAPTRGDLAALRLLAANHIHVVTLPPHLTHIMQPVDVCWARSFKTAYGRCLRTWVKESSLEMAYAQLPPAARRGRRSAARDSRVSIAFAAADAARVATTTFNASHAFSAAGLVPFRPEKALSSQYVRNCEADVEREEEAKRPHLLHTGSRVLTSPEFLELLTAFHARLDAHRRRAQAQAMETYEERLIEDLEAWAATGQPPTTEARLVEDELDVDLLAPTEKAFNKLTAETERIAPTAPDDEK